MRRGEHLDLVTTRVRRLARLVGIGFVVVASGYWYVQIAQARFYRQLAENNRLREEPMKAPRGSILDRKGRLLVENVPSYNLRLDRSQAEDQTASLEFAAGILARPMEALGAVLSRYRDTPRFVPVLIAEDLSLAQAARFEAHGLDHPEFRVEVEQRRLYRHGVQTAHLLGYLGEATNQDLANDPRLSPGDLIGREGIEQAYDDRLRGRDGERVLVVDSRGKMIEEVQGTESRPGESVTLTIDLDLQQEAVHLLGGKAGAIVALDPRDGAVRALVSSPSYDPNVFARRLDPREWEALLSAPFQPLQNRSIQNAYAPGSVFKIVLAVAGLAEGAIDPTETVWCGGSTRLYNRPRRCWKRGGHGRVDLHDALKYSCDIYFYVQGQEIGIERIARFARRFGFGQPTGLKLSGERSGLVPDSAWSLRARNSPWYPGETISVAIGQGPLLTTPLQVAVMMAGVANGGMRVVPHLVEGAGPPPEPLGLDARQLTTVREALRAVVNDGGSGATARLREVEIAGKTGTAQVIEQKTWTDSDQLPYKYRDHAWFVSFASHDRPELVIAVFVEHGGHGSRAAAPIAKAMYEKYFELLRDET